MTNSEKLPFRIKVLNVLKKMGVYDFLRINYHKNIAYTFMSPIWDLKNKKVKIKFKGIKFEFILTDEKNRIYDRPIYKCEPLVFFKNELNGYIHVAPPKKEGVLIDIGSYQGAFSIFWKKLINKKAKIICFEPDKENISVMRKNFKLNHVEDFKIIEKGVWNKVDTIKFSANGEAGHISKTGEISIQVTDLDSELKRLKISPKEVSFVKMDIEGAELEAIDGMKELLTKGAPQLSIASYHFRDNEQTYLKVEKN